MKEGEKAFLSLPSFLMWNFKKANNLKLKFGLQGVYKTIFFKIAGKSFNRFVFFYLNLQLVNIRQTLPRYLL